MTLSQMADGAAGAANVALEVNTRRSEGQKKIHAIDIGGGLPVTWGGNPEPTYEQYAAVLREKVRSRAKRATRRVYDLALACARVRLLSTVGTITIFT